MQTFYNLDDNLVCQTANHQYELYQDDITIDSIWCKRRLTGHEGWCPLMITAWHYELGILEKPCLSVTELLEACPF